jgi:tetratricopeptide (TPR) repeat protein
MSTTGGRSLVVAAIIAVFVLSTASANEMDDVAQLMDEGWLDDAEALLNEYIARSPDDPDLYYQLATLYLWRDDAQSANGGAPWEYLNKIEDYAEKAIDLNPNDARYYVIYGHAVGLKAMRGGKVKMFSRARAAKSRYETASEMDPSNIEAKTSLIEYLMQAPGVVGGDKDEARRLAAVVAELDSAAGFRAWKSIYLHEKDYDALEAAIRAVIQSRPEEKSGYEEFARLCRRREDFDCAIEYTEKILALEPGVVEPYWHLSRIYVSRGSLDTAERELLTAVELKPDEAHVYRWLGDFCRKQERWDDAIAWYQKSLAVDPGHARALYALGETYLEADRDLATAEECFNTYLQTRLKYWWPEPALAHCQLAKIYTKQGNKKAAKSEIKKARKLNPSNDEIQRTAKEMHIR